MSRVSSDFISSGGGASDFASAGGTVSFFESGPRGAAGAAIFAGVVAAGTATLAAGWVVEERGTDGGASGAGAMAALGVVATIWGLAVVEVTGVAADAGAPTVLGAATSRPGSPVGT